MKAPYNLDMFDINGANKLDVETIEQREAIISHYAKDPLALFFVSTSGGKDSQIMSITVRKLIPEEQIIYVHANLGEDIEHTGIVEHIKKDLPDKADFHIVKNERKDFTDMVLLRGMFPSAATRQCTSDLKTSQIEKLIRKVMNEKGAKVGFNVTGLRSEESVPRAKRSPLFVNKKLTGKGKKRVVYDWLPVFHLTEQQVFEQICEAGQEPFHIYGIINKNNKPKRVFNGNRRTSCKFCILGCTSDLENAAKWYPEEYAKLSALEEVTAHSMFFKRVKGEPIKVRLRDKAKVDLNNEKKERWKKILSERQILLVNIKAEEDRQRIENRKNISNKRQRDTNTIEMF